METVYVKGGIICLWFLTFKLNYYFVLKKSYNNGDKIASNFYEIIQTLVMGNTSFIQNFQNANVSQ